ncbi:MAG: hypothetical protein OHK0052_04180 [Anaerolineales bacterium]
MTNIKDIVVRVKENPQDPGAWFELSGALFALGKNEEAEYSRARAQKLLNAQQNSSSQVSQIAPPATQTLPPKPVQKIPPSSETHSVLPSDLMDKMRPAKSAFISQTHEMRRQATPMYQQVKQSSQNALESTFGWLQYNIPLILASIIAQIRHYLPIVLSALKQVVVNIWKFIIKFLFYGSGNIHPLLRLYYVCNLILTPVFLYIMFFSGGSTHPSEQINLLIYWLVFAILVDSRARNVAWGAGQWLVSFLLNAVGSLDGSCFFVIVGMIILLVIFIYAFLFAIVLGSIVLWFIAIYELGKDALSTPPML